MARARNIKPGFFKNDDLAALSPYGRLLFAGLWTIADKKGRLFDKVKRIKAEVLPYDDVDVEALLQDLHEGGFIKRYSIDLNNYIQIINWEKHQNPHRNEVESEIPEFEDIDMTVFESDSDFIEKSTDLIGTSTDNIGTTRADSFNLIPDSLNLIPLEKSKSNRQRFDPDPYIKKFNDICQDLSKVEKITDERKKKLHKILMDYGDDKYFLALTKVHASDFLSGRAATERPWASTFDWILKPANFIKIIEGQYDNKAPKLEPIKSVIKPNKFHNFEQSKAAMSEAELDAVVMRKEEKRKSLRMVTDG
jgi:hypothetical protein